MADAWRSRETGFWKDTYASNDSSKTIYSWKELWLQIYLLLIRDGKFILNVTVTFTCNGKMQVFFFFFLIIKKSILRSEETMFDKFDFNKTFNFNPGIN